MGHLGPLVAEWRSANDHVHELEQQEAGWADAPEIAPLSGEFADALPQLIADPIFQRCFNVVPTTIGMVELDRLIVFQKQINLNYVRDVQSKLGSTPSPADIFKACLPFDHPLPKVEAGITGNSYIFLSPSNDLRILEPALLGPQQISGYLNRGLVAGVPGLMVGFGGNFLNAIYAEKRLVLNNGSHRAFALRDLGITHVPCIVQHATRREEFPIVFSSPDYFDPKLRKLVDVPRRVRQVKVSFVVEQIDIPVSPQ